MSRIASQKENLTIDPRYGAVSKHDSLATVASAAGPGDPSLTE